MAAPTIVQYKKGNSASTVTSLDVTFDSAPATNALIVVFAMASITDYVTDPGAITCSDNRGNSYTSRTTPPTPFNGCRSACFAAQAATNTAPFTVTVGCTTAATWNVIIIEVTGYSNAATPEQSGAYRNFWDSSSYPASPLNFGATSAAEQTFIGCLFSYTGFARGWSPGTGWTQLDETAAQTTYPNMHCLYKQVTSTGTYDPEWNHDGGGTTETHFHAISIVAGTDGTGGGPVGAPLLGQISL